MSSVSATDTDRFRLPATAIWTLAALALAWIWAFTIDQLFWRTNDNYAYGWAVLPLAAFFTWRRAQSAPKAVSIPENPASTAATIRLLAGGVLILLGLAVFPLEVLRTEYHQSGIVLWAINLVAVGGTLTCLWLAAGNRWLAWMWFPIVFFLTAVPWPARVEKPLVQGLMTLVAQVVTEGLLWCNVPVEANGAVLQLSRGKVGVVEACSGIRSLQSGLMISLAVGELMWLRRPARILLVSLTVGLALLSNFIRTFVLCWITEHQGSDAMHRHHDLVANVSMYSFYGIIWLLGMWLSGRHGGDLWPPAGQSGDVSKYRTWRWPGLPEVRPGLALGLLMFGVVQAWYLKLRHEIKPQEAPRFSWRIVDTNVVTEIPFQPEVTAQLGFTAGSQIAAQLSDSNLGTINAYRLFWAPSPQSRVALHHRPDVCMPGSGWEPEGDVKKESIMVDGVPLDFHVFQFRRPGMSALQYWGVWRNGQPVEMDFSLRLRDLPEVYQFRPSPRHLQGVEIVSLFFSYSSGQPPEAAAREVIPKLIRQDTH